MSEREPNKPLDQPGRRLECEAWEGMIADALDQSLSAADGAAFERHARECASCAQMLKETREGMGWMRYLVDAPEPPADLLKNILARTSQRSETETASAPPAADARGGLGIGLGPGLGSGLGAGGGTLGPAVRVPAWRRKRPLLPVVSHLAGQLLEPRLMMTVAMAFFSIALTLNLAGIKLSDLHASDFQPSRLRATLTRQYYSTNAQVTKYYENLRLVYEMEARVRQLRRSTEALPVSAPAPRPSANPTPRQPARDGSGGPSSTLPKGQQTPPPARQTRPLGDAAAPAEMVDRVPGSFAVPARERQGAAAVPAGFDLQYPGGKGNREVFQALRALSEDQAKRSLA